MGQSNYSLWFDGQNSYVEFSFAENHDLFNDFSIEVWVKFDSIPSGRILSKVGWFDPGDTVSSYSVYFDETKPYKVIFSSWVGEFPNIEHEAISTLSLNSEHWHYIVVTYTKANSTKKIYVDGVLAFNEDNTGNIGYNGRPLFVGAFKTNLGDVIFPFKGNIDEIRIWQKALTQEEILVNMNNAIVGNEINLVGLWHFNEGIGDTLFDSSLYNVKGVINEAIWGEGFVITSVNETKLNINNFDLIQNYPNPFNPSTTIEFTLPKTENVELKVYNILGKEVATLVSNKLNSGNHTYQFDGRNLASGVYYYQLVAGDYREVKKMILLR